MGQYTITTTPEQDLAIEAASRWNRSNDVDAFMQSIVNARLATLIEQVSTERRAAVKELVDAADPATLHKVLAVLETKTPGDPTPQKKS